MENLKGDFSNGVVGVGIDLCDVVRIKRLLEKYGADFAKKYFTPAEIGYCDKSASPAECYAARFAAKEAMSKALGTGFSKGITPISLSVEKDAQGMPVAVLDSAAQKRMNALGAKKMLISLTHLKDYAQAIAILSK